MIRHETETKKKDVLSSALKKVEVASRKMLLLEQARKEYEMAAYEANKEYTIALKQCIEIEKAALIQLKVLRARYADDMKTSKLDAEVDELYLRHAQCEYANAVTCASDDEPMWMMNDHDNDGGQA